MLTALQWPNNKHFTLYCGPDRVPKFKEFIPYFKKDGKTLIINTADNKRTPGISGTDARNAIVNNDIERFKRICPEPIWQYFDKLQTRLKEVQYEVS
jgi:hypothetical protein